MYLYIYVICIIHRLSTKSTACSIDFEKIRYLMEKNRYPSIKKKHCFLLEKQILIFVMPFD